MALSGGPAPGAAQAITARDVWRSFGRDRVLRGVSLDLPAGRALAVFGPNGSGKSTLLRVLAGLLRPARGAVRIFDEDPYGGPGGRARLGYVGHEPMLYGGLTVRENLALWAALYGLPGDGPADAACALMDLSRHRDTLVGRLSRGLMQRTALARALVHAPAVLLLDEPFAGLDPDAAGRLAAHLAAFREAGGALVFSTHHPAEAARLADDARVLCGGRLGAAYHAGGAGADAIEAWYRAAAAPVPS